MIVFVIYNSDVPQRVCWNMDRAMELMEEIEKVKEDTADVQPFEIDGLILSPRENNQTKTIPINENEDFPVKFLTILVGELQELSTETMQLINSSSPEYYFLVIRMGCCTILKVIGQKGHLLQAMEETFDEWAPKLLDC